MFAFSVPTTTNLSKLACLLIYRNIFRGGSRGRVLGQHPSDDMRLSNTTGILQKKKKTMRVFGIEVEQETRLKPSSPC